MSDIYAYRIEPSKLPNCWDVFFRTHSGRFPAFADDQNVKDLQQAMRDINIQCNDWGAIHTLRFTTYEEALAVFLALSC